ncbi:MAG: hypothetical protein M3142_06300 [Bacteroidota bacterium]|nr:hypothetical protein [Bacteroidota bacterium]
MRKLLLLFLLLSFNTFAQKDTLNIKSLTFNSDFEEKHFKNTIEKKQFDKVAMLLAINPAATDKDVAFVNQALQRIYTNLDAAKITSKPLPKQVKAIFQSVHNSYLKKYELIASFDQIMNNGVYNCVSASALYGLVLDHYNIPYEIKQLPTHVYLVADPKGSKITVESTDPNGGYFAPDAKFKKNYVEYLQKSKMVSAEEVRTKSIDELFNKNFQADKAIYFKQLVALQYFNEGIKQYDEQSFSKSTAALQKAYRLYPSPETRFLLTNSLANQMQGINYNNLEEVALLTSFYAMQPGDMYRDEFTNDFKRLTQKFLLDKNDTVFYRKIYKEFLNSARDTVSAHEIAYVFNFHNGRLNALNHRYDVSLEYLKQAYLHNPVSGELTGFIRAVLQDELSQNTASLNFVKSLDQYGKYFPFLKNEEMFQRAYLIAYSRAIIDYFNANMHEEAKKYLSIFEAKYKINKAGYEPQYVGNLYLAACGSYMRAKNLNLTKQYAKKGLAYDPMNIQLRNLAEIPANTKFN